MLEQFIKDAVILFATVDPIGTVTMFVALTAGRTKAERRRIAWRAVVVAGAILFGFMLLGQVVLSAMHVSLHSFQIAGALFLLFFGAQLTFGAMHALDASPEAGREIATFPLAMPGIASPGALTAAVVLTDNVTMPVVSQAITALALLAVLVVTYIFLRVADPVHRVLGRTGAAVAIRVLGLILAALAIEMLLQALGAAGILRAGAPGTLG